MERSYPTTKPTSLSIDRKLAGRLAWVLASVSILIVLAAAAVGVYSAVVNGDFRELLTHQAITPFTAIIYAIIGALVASRHPRNPIGWIFITVSIFGTFTTLASAYGLYGARAISEGALPGLDWTAWIRGWIWIPGVFLPTSFVMMYFPEGRLLSSRWRFVAWPAALGMAVLVLALALHPGPNRTWGLETNPFGIESARVILDAALDLGAVLLLVGLLGSLAGFVVRFRRSKGIERQQMKWLVYAGVLMALGFSLSGIAWALWPDEPLVLEGSIIVTDLSILAIALAASVAILRYRLYDIDLIINRTLVYLALTVGVIGIYMLVVGSVGLLFRQSGSLAVSLLATGMAALFFQPLRERLQRGVNRLMYGERDDPYAVLSSLGRRLEASVSPETTLPTVVETISHSLKLPYVSIELASPDGFHPAASFGLPPTWRDEYTLLPLVYQNQQVGRLSLAPRGRGESFTPAEQRLLEDIARHVGAAANAVQLNRQIQDSRLRIVSAREEERRRLRRDLHDGLGPQLAGLTLRIDAVRNLLPRDPDAADGMLTQIKSQTKTALSDIRRIAYNLRPPALDQLGLLLSIREHISSIDRSDGLEIVLDAPEDLPALPAAVEVAAYRIILEALTNVTRHANAQHCWVRLKVGDTLEIEISDDGRGLPVHYRAGVGLHAMRERAAELGGACTFARRPEGGTRVLVKLPLMLPSDTTFDGASA